MTDPTRDLLDDMVAALEQSNSVLFQGYHGDLNDLERRRQLWSRIKANEALLDRVRLACRSLGEGRAATRA